MDFAALKNLSYSALDKAKTYMPSTKTVVLGTLAATVAATAAYYYAFGTRDLLSSQPEICKPSSFLGMDDVPFFSGKVCVSIKDLMNSQPIAKTAALASQNLNATATCALEHAHMCFEQVSNATASAATTLMQTLNATAENAAQALNATAASIVEHANTYCEVIGNASSALTENLTQAFNATVPSALEQAKTHLSTTTAEDNAQSSKGWSHAVGAAAAAAIVLPFVTPFFCTKKAPVESAPESASEQKTSEELKESSTSEVENAKEVQVGREIALLQLLATLDILQQTTAAAAPADEPSRPRKSRLPKKPKTVLKNNQPEKKSGHSSADTKREFVSLFPLQNRFNLNTPLAATASPNLKTRVKTATHRPTTAPKATPQPFQNIETAPAASLPRRRQIVRPSSAKSLNDLRVKKGSFATFTEIPTNIRRSFAETAAGQQKKSPLPTAPYVEDFKTPLKKQSSSKKPVVDSPSFADVFKGNATPLKGKYSPMQFHFSGKKEFSLNPFSYSSPAGFIRGASHQFALEQSERVPFIKDPSSEEYIGK